MTVLMVVTRREYEVGAVRRCTERRKKKLEEIQKQIVMVSISKKTAVKVIRGRKKMKLSSNDEQECKSWPSH